MDQGFGTRTASGIAHLSRLTIVKSSWYTPIRAIVTDYTHLAPRTSTGQLGSEQQEQGQHSAPQRGGLVRAALQAIAMTVAMGHALSHATEQLELLQGQHVQSRRLRGHSSDQSTVL